MLFQVVRVRLKLERQCRLPRWLLQVVGEVVAFCTWNPGIIFNWCCGSCDQCIDFCCEPVSILVLRCQCLLVASILSERSSFIIVDVRVRSWFQSIHESSVRFVTCRCGRARSSTREYKVRRRRRILISFVVLLAGTQKQKKRKG